MMYYVDDQGVYLGAWDTEQTVGVEVPYAPDCATDIWNFNRRSYSPMDAVVTAKDYEHLAQDYLDTCAIELGYDNILTAITYANEPAVPKFQQDGITLRVKRSLVWAYCYEQLALVQSGARPKPTLQEFLGELQAITNEAL